MGGVRVRRARIEEVRPMAAEYLHEQETLFGRPTSQPLPQGGVFWVAEDDESDAMLGYAAGTLRPEGCTIGPIFTRAAGRRRGTGAALLAAIEAWVEDTRVPVMEVAVNAENAGGVAFLQAAGYRPGRMLMIRGPLPDGAEGRREPRGAAGA
jgi:GNAT superfamily N-acetyltransferase